jgi:hypothetical protein
MDETPSSPIHIGWYLIELIFRFFKHTLNGQQIISIYPAGMENYFTGMS